MKTSERIADVHSDDQNNSLAEQSASINFFNVMFWNDVNFYQ